MMAITVGRLVMMVVVLMVMVMLMLVLMAVVFMMVVVVTVMMMIGCVDMYFAVPTVFALGNRCGFVMDAGIWAETLTRHEGTDKELRTLWATNRGNWK